jgi:broad specificity phosphatase PhoE
VLARWPAELDAWRRRPAEANAPGGERLLDAARRVDEALTRILAALAAAQPVQRASSKGAGAASNYRDPVPGYASARPVDAVADPWAILVAHDGIFRLALTTLLGLSPARFWSLPFNLCALTVVGLHNGVATLRAHNLSEHLAPLADEARAAEEARGERRGAL